MKFRKKTNTTEATQWFKNGDHPLDDCYRPFEDTGEIPAEPREGKIVRYFRHPNIPDNDICTFCGRKMHDHGWIDEIINHTVCPGDWVVTTDKGKHYPINPHVFKDTFEKVEE